MNIFVDLEMPIGALKILQAETVGHQLLFPKTPTASVLAKATPDVQFALADIAFGQPDLSSIANAPRLKWIHVSSSGYTRYDTAQFRALAAERKITFTNSAGVYQEACAVHVLSFMLAQARNLPAALSARVANATPVWNQLRATSSTLRGETVLILGYGSIGRRLVELLQPFGMNFLAYRRKARGDENIPIEVHRESVRKSESGDVSRAIVISWHACNPGNRGYLTGQRDLANCVIAGVSDHQRVARSDENNSLRIKKTRLDTNAIERAGLALQASQWCQHTGVLRVLHDAIIRAVGNVIIVVRVHRDAVRLEQAVSDHRVHYLRGSLNSRQTQNRRDP